MPLRGKVRYRVKQTPAGPVRLAFRGKKKVVEAVNLRTKAKHSEGEFAAERKARKRR